ncbi:hypothetical protein V8E36_005429 [Tilletia maclaganii]
MPPPEGQDKGGYFSAARRGPSAMSSPSSSGAGAGTPVASVTYTASTALMHSALPGHLFTTLAPHLPLHNLHWKPDPALTYSFAPQQSSASASSAAGTSAAAGAAATPAAAGGSTGAPANANPIRTIQALPLSFEPFALAQARALQIQQQTYDPSAPQNATSQILDPAYPFVNLYLAVCPDSDTYRTTLRNEIRSWLVSIGAFSAALQVSASSLDEASEAVGDTTAGSMTSGTSKVDKHNSIPASGAAEPEFLIVLITPPEGMASDFSAAPGSPRADTPPVGGDGFSTPGVPPKSKSARTSTGSGTGTGFFSSMTASKNKGTSAVLEKMRADFNANKRERVVHISRLPPLPTRPTVPHRSSSVTSEDNPMSPRVPSSQLDPTIFMDLLTRLKECCSNSLTVVLKTRMASIRALLGAIEVLEPGPASPYWAGRFRAAVAAEARLDQDEGAKLFARYIRSQAFVLRCLEGLGLWEDALEGWNSVADTYMRLLLGGHDPFAPSSAAVLSAAIAQISLPMPHPSLLRAGNASNFSNSTGPHLIDPTDILPALPPGSNATMEFRIALYTRRATIQGAYLGKTLKVLQEGTNEVRDIGRTLVRLRETRRLQLIQEAAKEGADASGVAANLEGEVWAYQAALQLSRTCDSWVADASAGAGGGVSAGNASSSTQNLATPAFHAARSEILEVARRQMDRMGILVGWLPACEPWLAGSAQLGPLLGGVRGSLPTSASTAAHQSADDVSLVPEEVRSLFSSREIFDLRYSSLTERVLAACMLASSSTSPSGSSLSAVPAAVSGGGGQGGITGRRRHVLFLRIVLTSLDLLRGRWKEAYTALGPLADSCAPTISGPVPIASQNLVRIGGSAGSGWAGIEVLLRAQVLRAHTELSLPRDRAWVGAVIAWLRAKIGARNQSPLPFQPFPLPEMSRPATPVAAAATPSQEEEDKADQLDDVLLDEQHPNGAEPARQILNIDERSLFSALRLASAALDREVAISGFSPFEVLPAERVTTREAVARREGDEAASLETQALESDGHLLRVRFRSALETDVRVDDVRLCLTNGAREQLWFTSGKILLHASTPAETHQEVQLFCPSYAPGTYAVDVAQVRIAKVIFQIPLLPQSGPSSSADSNTAFAPGRLITSQAAKGIPSSMAQIKGLRSGMPLLVTVPEDAEALQASIQLPEVIRLGERRCGIIEIRPGRNMVRNADVHLLLLHEAAGGGSSAMAGLSEAVLLSDPNDEANTAELVPSSLSDSATATRGMMQLTNLSPHSVVRLQFPLLEATQLGTLPLMLSIDYYSSTGVDASGPTTTPLLRRQYRRVQDLVVSLPLGVNAQDFFRRNSLLCKFSISSAGGSRLRVQDPQLQLVSIEGSAAASKRFIVQAPSSSTAGSLLDQAMTVSPKQPASFLFKILPASGELVGPLTEPTVLELSLRYQLIKNASGATRGGEDIWQTIIIPVEVPAMDLVNEVDFHFLSRQGSTLAFPLTLEAGQPVKARFVISTTRAWSHRQQGHSSANGDAEAEKSEIMLYDVLSDLDTWLVCGSTRGTVSVNGDTPSSLEISLIPLREGPLPLPQLSLTPLEPERVASETYMINGSARVTVSTRRAGEGGGLDPWGAPRRISVV